jgi:hypothetical protein
MSPAQLGKRQSLDLSETAENRMEGGNPLSSSTLRNPGGSRSHFGALLLGYYTKDGRLLYAGRAGTGFNEKELKQVSRLAA